MNLLKDTFAYLLATLAHNAPILLFGIVVAAAITIYGNPDKIRARLSNRATTSVFVTVAFGAFTPFCACGTMAVVVAMLSTTIPWSAIMAFLTSSPLMSPDEFILISGIISPGFAIALTAASVGIGLFSGLVAHVIEKRTRFLDGQIRFTTPPASYAPKIPAMKESPVITEISTESRDSKIDKYKIKELLQYLFDIGVKQVLLYFSIFVAIGYLINRFVPTEWITSLLGSENPLAIPLMALTGLPLYFTGPSSIPIVQALMDSGAGTGALLAFMITGPGTSAGVIAGIATIMKRKAIALYLALMLFGAIATGYLAELILWLMGSQ
jgi:uncharacterized protein